MAIHIKIQKLLLPAGDAVKRAPAMNGNERATANSTILINVFVRGGFILISNVPGVPGTFRAVSQPAASSFYLSSVILK